MICRHGFDVQICTACQREQTGLRQAAATGRGWQPGYCVCGFVMGQPAACHLPWHPVILATASAYR